MDSKMNKVEQVAKALYDVAEPKPMLSWTECPVYIKNLWANQAVAAIRAMKEPTEFMVKCIKGAPQIGSPDFDGIDYIENMQIDFNLMLDAALEESVK